MTRHDPDNGAPGCAGCHLVMTRDPEKHREFFRRYLGEEVYERLRIKALGRGKTDMDLVLLSLKQTLGML